MTRHGLVLLFLYLVLLLLTPVVVIRLFRPEPSTVSTQIDSSAESPIRLLFEIEFPDWNGRNAVHHTELEADRSAFIGPAGGNAVIEMKTFLYDRELIGAGVGRNLTRSAIQFQFVGSPEFLSAGGRVFSASDTSVVLKLPAVGGTYRFFVDHRMVIHTISETGETVSLDEGRSTLYVLVPVPARVGENGFLGPYPMGIFPNPRDPRAPRAIRDHANAYAPPANFVEVKPGLRSLFISEHFRLDDFISSTCFPLPPGAPHYLALDYRIIEKMEQLIDTLEFQGRGPIHVTINSAFRSPHYNNAANTDRAAYSMHMYGGAVDFKIDGALGRREENATVDITGDRRVTMEDLRFVARVLEEMEAQNIVAGGGIGIYDSEHADGTREFYLHTDTRGYRARWGCVYRRGCQTAEDRWWRAVP